MNAEFQFRMGRSIELQHGFGIDDACHAQKLAFTVSEEWNPNGSYQCIEGITSPDGRILGKMGHNERCWSDTGMNIYGNQDMQLFASGVEYFK